MAGPRPWMVVLFAILILPTMGGAADAEFNATLWTSSVAKIEGFKAIEAERSLVSTRYVAEASRPLFLTGQLQGAKVVRYETEWLVPPEVEIISGARLGPVRETQVTLEQAHIRLAELAHQAAVVFSAEDLQAAGRGAPWQSIGMAQDPAVGLANTFPTYGARAGPNETRGWIERGQFAGFSGGGIEGSAHGALHLYWFQSTIALQSLDAFENLESSVCDEASIPGTRTHVRHAVWYELWAESGRLEFYIPDESATFQAMLFAERLTFDSVEAASFDHVERIEGSLPEGSRIEGHSLWISGAFSSTFLPLTDAARTMEIRNEGSAVAFSIAGADTMAFPVGPATVAGFFLAAGLVAALRFMIPDLLGRLWLVLFARLSRDRVLDHPLRRLVYEHIRSGPGVHFSALRSCARAAGYKVDTGRLMHHLLRLQSCGFVVTRKVGRYRRYYDAASCIGAERQRFQAALLVGRARLVAHALSTNPGISARHLRGLLGQEAPTTPGVRFILRRLESFGLATTKEEGRQTLFFPAGQLLAAPPNAWAIKGEDVGSGAIGQSPG